MSNIILTQIAAQATFKFYIITSAQLHPSFIISTFKFIIESSKSVFQLVPFSLKHINVTQSFTDNGISGKCFH